MIINPLTVKSLSLLFLIISYRYYLINTIHAEALIQNTEDLANSESISHARLPEISEDAVILVVICIPLMIGFLTVIWESLGG